MSRRKKQHWLELPQLLKDYADSRTIDFQRYSKYHMRLIDGFTILDCWTTGKYWIMQTEYHSMTEQKIVERGGEKGWLPGSNLTEFLDKIFYAPDMAEGEL